MKDKLVVFLQKFEFTRGIIYILLRIKHNSNIKNAAKLCHLRREIDLFDYEKLAENLASPLKANEIQFYGFNHVLADYLKVSKLKKHVTNEHGFIFSSFVSDYYTPKNVLLTFSDYREQLIKRKYTDALNIVKIGPYIHYAESLLSFSELNALKKNLGKTLLVFPFHSIDGVLSSFDTNTFIEEVKKYKIDHNFDTVVVCLYWKDIQIGRAKEYMEQGYKVTTAGHIYDMFFLNRLRSIIEISDFVISNELGTYIGYCLSLNKQIRLINQKSDFEIEKGQEEHVNSKGFLEVEKHMLEYHKLQNKLMSILSTETIEPSDLDFVKDLFGLQYIKSKEELHKILK